MRFEESLSLGNIQHGARLQKAAVKLQSYAALTFRHGSNFGHDLLVKFWQDQLKRVDMKSGLPSDGVWTGFGTTDIRRDCYLVQSAVRMSGNASDKKRLKDFIIFFINAAWSLNKARTKVASVVAVPVYDDPKGFSHAGQLVQFQLKFLDAAGREVPASPDNPLIGTVAAKLDNEAAPEKQGQWRGEAPVRSTPHTYFLGGISTQKPGMNTAHFRYTADAIPPLEVAVQYARLNANGELPKPVDPAPAGKNGVAA